MQWQIGCCAHMWVGQQLPTAGGGVNGELPCEVHLYLGLCTLCAPCSTTRSTCPTRADPLPVVLGPPVASLLPLPLPHCCNPACMRCTAPLQYHAHHCVALTSRLQRNVLFQGGSTPLCALREVQGACALPVCCTRGLAGGTPRRCHLCRWCCRQHSRFE